MTHLLKRLVFLYMLYLIEIWIEPRFCVARFTYFYVQKTDFLSLLVIIHEMTLTEMELQSFEALLMILNTPI